MSTKPTTVRSMWSGEITFGMVAIPVKLYTGVRDSTPHFHLLHKSCATRVSTVRRCEACAQEVAWDDIGKGYEVEKGQYALFTKEELAALEDDGASSGSIDIAEFVPVAGVDPVYFDKSYWIAPGGKTTRGYGLLLAILTETGSAGVAHVKLRSRPRLSLVRTRAGMLALDTLRFDEELVSHEAITPADIKAPTEREKSLALSLVEQLTSTFDPAKYTDNYRAAVLAAVDKKVETNEVSQGATTSIESGGGGKLLDLADLLAQSLKGGPGLHKARATQALAKTG